MHTSFPDGDGNVLMEKRKCVYCLCVVFDVDSGGGATHFDFGVENDRFVWGSRGL